MIRYKIIGAKANRSSTSTSNSRADISNVSARKDIRVHIGYTRVLKNKHPIYL